MDNKSFFWAVTNRAGVKSFQKGCYAEAEGYFAQALSYAEQHFAPDDARVETSQKNLRETKNIQAIRNWDLTFRAAVAAQNDGRYAEAEELYSTAMLYARTCWSNDTRLADTIAGKASCLCLLGRHHDAEALYFEALEIRSSCGPAVHPATASIYSALALIQVWRRRFAYAEKLAWKAIEIRLQIVRPDHADLGQDVHSLAAVFHAQQNYKDAEPMYRQSLSILQRAYGIDHDVVQTATRNFTTMLKETEPGACGDPNAASEAMEQFKALLKAVR
jgi:tetratricopeptide (TPR) repeat protein